MDANTKKNLHLAYFPKKQAAGKYLINGDVSQWGKIPHWGHIYIQKNIDKLDSFVYNIYIRIKKGVVQNG